jgi:hypothetical protein
MNSELDAQAYARVGGVLYVMIIILGIIQEAFIRGRVTAGNLQKLETLWRAGIAIEMVTSILTIGLAVVLYVLTRPVQRDLALLALLFGSIATAVQSAYSIQLVEALLPIGGNAYLAAFTPAQRQAMTALAMKAHVFGFGIALLLFGPFFLVTGYLIFRSGFWPKALGVLYQLAGVAYMFNGFVLLLAPRLSGGAFMIMAGPAFIGEASFALYLLTRGVRVDAWRRVAAPEVAP